MSFILAVLSCLLVAQLASTSNHSHGLGPEFLAIAATILCLIGLLIIAVVLTLGKSKYHEFAKSSIGIIIINLLLIFWILS